MPLVQTAVPGLEPITTAEAKNYLRLDADLTQDDTLIAVLISAARAYAESYCNRSLVQQGWQLLLDSFPSPQAFGVPWGQPWSIPANAIQLERGPVITLDSIKYRDMGGTLQTMASSLYTLDASSPMPRVTPVFGAVWPVSLPQIGAVQVNYTAGYGVAATDVPAGIRQWLLLRVSTLYRNREEVAILGRGKVDPLPFVDCLLDPYRVIQG
jgi:uncharacterized phiE125 gp8 family phage protein